ADVYSLACLLYECLTGRVPFPGPSRLAVAWAHLEEEAPRASDLAGLPHPVDAVLRKGLAKEPEERYTTCRALVDDAEQALGLRPAAPRQRRRILLGAAAALALGALAAGLATLLVDRGARQPAAPLYARANTLARIDPATNAVSDVIDVGRPPAAVA